MIHTIPFGTRVVDLEVNRKPARRSVHVGMFQRLSPQLDSLQQRKRMLQGATNASWRVEGPA